MWRKASIRPPPRTRSISTIRPAPPSCGSTMPSTGTFATAGFGCEAHGRDRLLARGGDPDKYAQIHADIIRRFGRFPHRNAALGRITTPEEQAFLDAGGFAG